MKSVLKMNIYDYYRALIMELRDFSPSTATRSTFRDENMKTSIYGNLCLPEELSPLIIRDFGMSTRNVAPLMRDLIIFR